MVLTRKTALTCVLERKIETGHRAHRKQSHGENGLFSGPFQPPNQAPGALGLRRALGTAARLLQPMLSVPSNRGAATELWFPKAASLAFSRDDAQLPSLKGRALILQDGSAITITLEGHRLERNLFFEPIRPERNSACGEEGRRRVVSWGSPYRRPRRRDGNPSGCGTRGNSQQR